MSKFKKLIESLRQNPNHVRYEDVEKILIRLGFEKRQGSGSHVVFTKGDARLTIPKPHSSPYLKPVYVKMVVEALEESGFDDDFE